MASPFTDKKIHHPTESDEAAYVIEQARTRLRDSLYTILQYVQCEYHDGVLTLRGRVPSFYMKQMAQEVVSKLHSVHRVVNLIEVEVRKHKSW